MGKQRKEKLWLIREKDQWPRYCIAVGKKPVLDEFGSCNYYETSLCNTYFERFTGFALKPGQCIEITGFKVLLPKSRPAKRKGGR